MKPVLVAEASEPRVAAAGTLGLDIELGRQASSNSAAGTARQRDIADSAARVLIIALVSFMAVRLGADFLNTGRLTGLLLLASEALVVVLTVFRRAPATVDRSIRARVLTTLSILGPPLVRPASVAPI